MDLIAQGKQARTEYENRTLGRDQAEARRDLHGTLQRLRQERRALTKSIRINEAKKRKERFQDLYNAKQKLASSMINNKKGKRVEPNTLKDGTSKQVMYKQADVLAETQRYYQELNAPPPGGKCQQYLPDQCHRCYPWIRTDALDTFHLESHIGQKKYKFINLDDHIRDQTAFQQCLRNTKLGKAPGPAQVPNELLRYMPLHAGANCDARRCAQIRGTDVDDRNYS
ncbi:hypothetical protein WJX84_000572 [Apatococcus fuscideae]|uniref:C2H2-type domain-containing protein n=1 Tax=Apatococcus fuscideae TaxID=2026836 RepID=A0AAW1T4A4_9CHLO